MFHTLFAGLAVVATAGFTPSLTLDQVLAHAHRGLAEARLAAELTEIDAQLTQTRAFLRESPNLASQLGRRHQSSDGDTTDFGLDLEVPLASGASRASRNFFTESLTADREVLVHAARLTDRQLLVEAYLTAWAAQQRLALRRDDERLIRDFARLLREQIAAGAVAAYHAELMAAEWNAARGLVAEAEAEQLAAWSSLQSLTDLPAEPVPRLERPAWTDPPPTGQSILASSLLAEQRIADLRRRWLQDRELSRSSVTASLARDGGEDVALVGWRWRIPLAGERQAITQRTASQVALREVETRRQLAELETRRQRSRALLAALPESRGSLTETATAWQAVELRVREGKDSPAEAMAVRRALIAAQLTAFDLELRRLTAQAELAFLTQETLP